MLVTSITSESLRADLIELGRDDDVDRYVAESDAMRRVLTDGETAVTAKLFRSLPTQREISGLMFHLNGQKLEWEMARRLVPPQRIASSRSGLARIRSHPAHVDQPEGSSVACSRGESVT